jgi:GH24 family phage-related lysozyme (muramidase)
MRKFFCLFIIVAAFIACSPREQADKGLQSVGREFIAPNGSVDLEQVSQPKVAEQAPAPKRSVTKATAPKPKGAHRKPYVLAGGVTTTDVFKMCLTDLKYHEWYKCKVYHDPGTVNGKKQKNIGYGTKLPEGFAKKKISELEASQLAINVLQKEYDQSLKMFPHLSYHQHMAVALKAYNMGWTRFSKTRTFYKIASKQTPTRTEWIREATFVNEDGKRVVSEKMKLRREFEYNLFCGQFEKAKKHTEKVRLSVHAQIRKELQSVRG